MKKNLFLISVVALALGACSNDSTIEQNTATELQPAEIAFSPLTQNMTRAAVDGTTFTPTTMKVTAYDATTPANYFGATTFTKDASTWKGGKYWPFAPVTINFLAIANANADNETGVTWGPTISSVGSNPTEKVQIVMGDNKTNQYDLMYACGTGTVTQTGSPANTLNFPSNVPMEFKHAQAWVKFTVKAGDAATASALTVNSITLNSVSCQGTYLVTHANWNETKASRDAAGDGSKDGSVSGAWSDYSTYADDIAAVKDAGYSTLSTSVQDFASLMVVPNQGIASFTINYSFGGNTYNYTYTPASTALAQATKYTYNITLTLHEIEIAATVDDWDEGGPTAVSL